MAYMYIKWFLLTLFLLILVARTGAKVPAIIVFGDSFVDAGNNNQVPTKFPSTILKHHQNISKHKNK